jgi:hypothetical protein
MIRLQLRLKDVAEQLFKSITQTLGIAEKDAVLDGLALLHFAMTEVERGRQIGSYDPEKREFTAWTTASLESLRSRVAQRSQTQTPAVARSI